PYRTAGAVRASGFLVDAVVAQALRALAHDLLEGLRLQLVQVAQNRIAHGFRHRLRVAVRATERLANHLIHDAQLRNALGAHAHRLGRKILLIGAAPENARAPLRRDHRIDAVLEHEQAIADADRQCAARAALPD